MNIALDLRYDQPGLATFNLHNLVPEILAADRINRYILLKNASQTFSFESNAADTLVCPDLPALATAFWTNVSLPKKFRALDVEVYHSFRLNGYVWNPSRTVMTVYPTGTSESSMAKVNPVHRLVMGRYARWLIRRAGRLISPTDVTRRALMTRYSIDAERIDVIPLGPDPRFRALSPVETMRITTRLGLPRRYFLCAGEVLPTNGQETAVRAGAMLKEKFSIDLVLAGKADGAAVQRINNEAGRLGLLGRVHLVGCLSEDDLVGAMNGAEALLAPHLKSPPEKLISQASACGLPIVASNNAKDLADAAERILESESHRLRLREEALDTAKENGWQAAALLHVALYKSVSASSVA